MPHEETIRKMVDLRNRSGQRKNHRKRLRKSEIRGVSVVTNVIEERGTFCARSPV